MIAFLATTTVAESSQILELSQIDPKTIIRIAVLLFFIGPLIYVTSNLAGRFAKERLGQHVGGLIQKTIQYVGIITLFISVLLELGFNLGALIGAAGIASVALGFASQTSLSNIISGVFLYGEKPFQIGDIITVNGTTGIVLSIDLLSVKLRQFDNQFVRIPNETMIKTEVKNITKFPIRRVDIEVGVSYKSNVDQVIRVLHDIAESNPYSLNDPNPIVIFKSFGDSSLNFMIAAWCVKEQFLDLKNSLMRDIKSKFDECSIEIPFPQRVVHFPSTDEHKNAEQAHKKAEQEHKNVEQEPM